MKYQLPSSGPVGGELRRIALEEIERARTELIHSGANGDAAAHVHKARGHLKRTRALLRLARPTLGKREFWRGNVAIRDAGREIREARDAVALIEALDYLTKSGFPDRLLAIVRRLRVLLVADSRKLSRALKFGEGLSRASRLLELEHDHVYTWSLKDLSRKEGLRAWRRARKRCREASRIALADTTDGNLHEWRKRTKTLLNETDLLRKRCPDTAENRHQIKKLALILGMDRDLSMLRQAIIQRKGALRSAAELKLLLAALGTRRRTLRVEAFALAERM